MKIHFEQLRFAVAEMLIDWAFRVLPTGREKREMAVFLQHSWIARMAATGETAEAAAARTSLQREWQRKVAGK